MEARQRWDDAAVEDSKARHAALSAADKQAYPRFTAFYDKSRAGLAAYLLE
ncbi:hypothetical protein [Arthrobacter sp. OAP107]|uniref:hypothetical protein n=1 Tax=Arthrobacter sp. OAP107 TaxID=3156445 RepID=UPI00339B51BD